MLSKELKRKQYILKVLSDIHSVTIILELVNARDAGKYPMLHNELSYLVNVAQHEAINWQWAKRELVDNLGIVELLVEEGKPYGPDSISYRLNPQMDSFCAELIEMMFKAEVVKH